MSTHEPNPDVQVAPGAATRDYARDSIIPFQPLVTEMPNDETTPFVKPSPAQIPTWALVGVGGVCALVFVGIGSALLF